MKQRFQNGSIVEIPISDGYFVYGGLCFSCAIAIYKQRFKSRPENLSIFDDFPIMFCTGLYGDSIKNGLWPKVCKGKRDYVLPIPFVAFIWNVSNDTFYEHDIHSGQLTGDTVRDHLGRNYPVLASSRLKYNGKEQQDIASLSLPYLDYGARLYNPAILRWNAQDPLQEKYYGVSPFAYCAGSPVLHIDTDGRLTDNYILSKNGSIDYMEGTDDPYDKIYATNSEGIVDENNFICMPKDVIQSKSFRNNEENSKNQFGVGTVMYSMKGDIKSKEIFGFLAANSNVEWSLTRIGSKDSERNIISSTFQKYLESGPGHLFMEKYTIRGIIHSHPDHKEPSESDKELFNKVFDKFKVNEFEIFYDNQLYKYDKDGAIIAE